MDLERRLDVSERGATLLMCVIWSSERQKGASQLEEAIRGNCQ